MYLVSEGGDSLDQNDNLRNAHRYIKVPLIVISMIASIRYMAGIINVDAILINVMLSQSIFIGNNTVSPSAIIEAVEMKSGEATRMTTKFLACVLSGITWSNIGIASTPNMIKSMHASRKMMAL